MSPHHLIPSGRTGHIAVTYKDYILVWGGYKESTASNEYYPADEIYLYSPHTETWSMRTTSIENGPFGMSGSAAAVIHDFLYLFGGYGYETEGSINHLYRLDLENLVWEKLEPAGCKPYTVDKMVAWSFEDKFYTFGGFGCPITLNFVNTDFDFVFDQTLWKGWTNQFYEYDPEVNEWKTPPYIGELPLPRAAHAAAVVDNKVYIFGGRHNQTRLNDLHCLDMKTLHWSGSLKMHGPVPEGRSWHSLTSISSTLLLLYGGFSQNNVSLSDCWILDVITLTWKPVSLSFQKPRLWHSACFTVFNEVFIFGGCSSNILATDRTPGQAEDIIIIRVSPKSLFRLCIDKVGSFPQLRPYWSMLPYDVREILTHLFCRAIATSVDGS